MPSTDREKGVRSVLLFTSSPPVLPPSRSVPERVLLAVEEEQNDYEVIDKFKSQNIKPFIY